MCQNICPNVEKIYNKEHVDCDFKTYRTLLCLTVLYLHSEFQFLTSRWSKLADTMQREREKWGGGPVC